MTAVITDEQLDGRWTHKRIQTLHYHSRAPASHVTLVNVSSQTYWLCLKRIQDTESSSTFVYNIIVPATNMFIGLSVPCPCEAKNAVSDIWLL